MTKKLLPPHVRKFVRKIEETHRGLGIPILIQYIAYEGKVSLLWIASKGVGKSTIIENCKPFGATLDVPLYQVTKTKLTEYLEYVENTTIVLRITELAQLSQYQKQIFLDMVGTIITSRNFDYTISEKKKIKIVNCDLVVTAGIQPLTYSKMTLENLSWSEFASDRLLKIMLINPIREDSVIKKPNIDLELLYSKYDPREPRINEAKVDISKLVNLLKRQLTKWRAIEFARKLIKGYLKLIGKHKATQKDIDTLYIMLYPYVHSFNALNVRLDIGEQKQIYGAGLELFSVLSGYFGKQSLTGVPKRELAQELDVSVRAVEKVLKNMKELNIDIIENEVKREGKTQRAYISLSKELKAFFLNYDKLFL